MTNRHSFIKFLLHFGACPSGIRKAKRHRTPQQFWDSRSVSDLDREWLLTACRVRGFFPENNKRGCYGPMNGVLILGDDGQQKFPRIPWKRGQRGQFVYRFQRAVARKYAHRIQHGKDPLIKSDNRA